VFIDGEHCTNVRNLSVCILDVCLPIVVDDVLSHLGCGVSMIVDLV
jgi:hypothetical protein